MDGRGAPPRAALDATALGQPERRPATGPASTRRSTVAEEDAGVNARNARSPNRGLVGRPAALTNRVTGRLVWLATTLRCMASS